LGETSVFLSAELFEDDNPFVNLSFTLYSNSSLFPLDEQIRRNEFFIGTPVVGATVARMEIVNRTDAVEYTVPVIVNPEVIITFCHFHFPFLCDDYYDVIVQ